MGLLKELFRKETLNYTPGTIYAPLDGRYIPMEEVADPVFSSGMLGKGIGIEPQRGLLYAPADGIVTLIAKTKHAIGITTPDGAELLLHIGLDTVEMNGNGFQCLVQQNQSVSLGQCLMRFSLDKIRDAGHGTTVLVVLTNAAQYHEITFETKAEIHRSEAIGHYDNLRKE